MEQKYSHTPKSDNSCRFVFPLAPKVVRPGKKPQNFRGEVCTVPCNPMQTWPHHCPLRFLFKPLQPHGTPISPVFAPAALLAQFCFCNAHTAQARQQDFGQAPERRRMLGQSGSRHRHSTAFGSHPSRNPPACPQPPHQAMGQHHRSQRASAARPQILCLTQNCLPERQ